jgi:beta-phosphoglucomutase-like phosphatase (HAD superfamily)
LLASARRKVDSVLSRYVVPEWIFSADMVVNPKPAPDLHFLALADINNSAGEGTDPVQPSECLVVEDSADGVAAAETQLCLFVWLTEL